MYSYEVNLLGESLQEGKVIPKELSEEEKAEAEAAKGGKGAKAPPPPKGKKEDEGPRPGSDEAERLERERQEKEERDRQLAEEWDALDENERFFRSNEDIYKEPCIRFQRTVTEDPEEEGGEPTVYDVPRMIESEKNGAQLLSLEESVKGEKGCWLFFNKLVLQGEEDPAAAAADPKKKAAPKGGKPEEVKNAFAVGWFDLADLAEPGETEVERRVFLKTAAEKRGTPLPEGGAEGAEGAPAEGEEQKDSEKVFEDARTYVHVRVSVDESIVPPRFKQILQPQPHELVEKKPPQPKIPHIKNPEEDYRRQLRLAVESILKEYYTMFR